MTAPSSPTKAKNTPLRTTPAPQGDPLVVTGIESGPVQAITMNWPGDCGGECVFLGRTRNEVHRDHGALVRLEYEIYEPMAAKLLDAMAADAITKFGCRAVRVVHAEGAVAPGEASVVIQTATPHRGEAFDSCRYLIDRIKHELPIWKHEIWEHGRTFVDGCCAHH